MRVLLLVSAAVSIVMTIIMVFFLRAHRNHAGFAHWTVGTGLVALSFLAAGMRGLVPVGLSVLGTNLAAFAAPPVFLAGTRRFLGLSALAWPWYAVPAAGFVVNLYFLVVVNDITARTAIQMAVAAGLYAVTGCLLAVRRTGGSSLLARALAAQFAVIAVLMAARAVWALGQPGFHLLLESPAQYEFFGAVIVLHLAITVSFILLTTERVAAELSGAHAKLEAQVEELRRALAEVKTLRGLLPVCSSCKRIRDDEGAWIQMEVYVRDRSQAEFTHGLCPECLPKYFPGAGARRT